MVVNGGQFVVISCQFAVSGGLLVVNGGQLVVNGGQLVVNGGQLVVNGDGFLAGYYCQKELIPASAYRIFNTWMGDPVRLLQLEAVLKCVKDYSLLENAQITGEYLLKGIKAIQVNFTLQIHLSRTLVRLGQNAAVSEYQ